MNLSNLSFRSKDIYLPNLVRGEAMQQHLLAKKLEYLTPEEVEAVKNAWKDAKDDEVMGRLSRDHVDGRSLRMLQLDCWLNDRIINFYMALLNERNKILYNWTKSLRSYFFDSFFLVNLVDSEGNFTFKKVRDSTSKINIFKAEKLFFPVFEQNHWMLIVVYMVEKKIQFLNSMGTTFLEKGNHSMDLLLDWLSCESERLEQARYHNIFCKDEWEKTLTWEKSVIPQQINSYDCGVYVIVFADFLSDDLAVSKVFLSTIVFYRKKIAYYILKGGIPSHENSFEEEV